MHSDNDILLDLRRGDLRLHPYERTMVQPASVDVRIDKRFLVFNSHLYTHIDPAIEQPQLTTSVEVQEDEPFYLHPGEFVLASTWERVTLSTRLSARLEGKSSLGRLGLMVHSTAGFIDPGFSGHITLELSNVANLPIAVWPGMRIGQLCVFGLSTPATDGYGAAKYGSRYQDQLGFEPGPVPSRSYANFTRFSPL